jgi:hypothetical protein
MPQVTGTNRALGLWQKVDEDRLLTFPTGWEPDASIVDAIRKVVPHFVPALLVQKYMSPSNEEKTFGFYLICMWWPSAPEEDKGQVIHAPRPDDFPFQGGVVTQQVIWQNEPGEAGRRRGLPPLSRPFDGRIRDWILAAYSQFHGLGAKALKEKIERSFYEEGLAEEAALRKVQDDHRGRLLDDKRQLNDAITNDRWFAPTPSKPARFVFKLNPVVASPDISASDLARSQEL